MPRLREQAERALAVLMGWQEFGPAWDKAVAAGTAPAVMTGCIPPRGAEDRRWSKQEWKDGVVSRCMRDNLRTMNALALFARAYRNPWSKLYGSDELIDRTISGLDFWCVAQGHNGGFVDIWSHRWVGGPSRRRAGGCLEGFGHQGLATAFLLAHRELELEGALEQTIDNDGDRDTPALTRRVAYGQLFRKSRDYLVSPIGRGHAPNQDLGNIIAAWLANDCVEMLEPGRAWPRALALDHARSAVGLARDPYGGRWVSPRGLAMEPNGSSNGGYCGNYGEGCVAMICRVARLSGQSEIQQRARDAVTGFAWFRYPCLDAEGHPCLRKEEVISWRNNRWPGRTAYGVIPYAALELRDPTAIRLACLHLNHGRAWTIELDSRNAHFIAHVTAAMDLLDAYKALEALQPSGVRLAMERGAGAWADPVAGTVAIRQPGIRLYAALHWRHGFKPGTTARSPANASPNHIARVHCTTPTIDRIATMAMPQAGRLAVCRYGPYLIVLNQAADAARLPPSARAGLATC